MTGSGRGLTIRSTGAYTACRYLARHFILGQIPSRRSGPVSSNVRPRIFLLWLFQRSIAQPLRTEYTPSPNALTPTSRHMRPESVCQSPPPGNLGAALGFHRQALAACVLLRQVSSLCKVTSAWPNPSVNRTLHGMPGFGPPFHSGPNPAIPFRAGYLKR